MKKLLLTVLACGMFASAFAQPDTLKKSVPDNSEKWVINKVNSKTATGKLIISLPKGTAWDITIYNAGTSKVVSNTMLKTVFPLPPGSYDLEINHIWVRGVQIEKGNTTRLKAGVLDVTTTGAWTLYDETKETVLINTYHPQKRGLPVGKYILSEAGQDRAIEIRDSGSPLTDNVPHEHLTIDAAQYTMTRVPNGEDTAMQTKGRLHLRFPLASTAAFFPIRQQISIHQEGRSGYIYTCSLGEGPPCPASYHLDEGVYDVYFYMWGSSTNPVGGGNPIIVKNVTIRKGFETKLKVGYKGNIWGKYQMYDSSHQSTLNKYLAQAGGILVFPIGSYWFQLSFVGEYLVQIKKDEIAGNMIPDLFTPPNSRTITTFIKDEKPDPKKGRLNTSFPEATFKKLEVRLPNSNNSGYIMIRLDTVRTYDLLAGTYKVYLNDFEVDVVIQAGRETKIRFGYLNIEASSFKLSRLDSTGYNHNFGHIKIAVPFGYYKMIVSTYTYLVKVTEGETMEFSL